MAIGQGLSFSRPTKERTNGDSKSTMHTESEALMPQPATIITTTDRRGREHQYWSCPNCRRQLGEIVGCRLVIVVRHGWNMSQPLVDGTNQSCPHCHVISVWSVHEVSVIR